jgi:hypothetical protein
MLFREIVFAFVLLKLLRNSPCRINDEVSTLKDGGTCISVLFPLVADHNGRAV